jgi:hypothetical protein
MDLEDIMLIDVFSEDALNTIDNLIWLTDNMELVERCLDFYNVHYGCDKL